MRTFSRLIAGSVVIATLAIGSAMARDVTFRSPDDAMKQGISAFNGGYYELALPAFEALEITKPQIAHFYEARIYGDNDGAYTDHGKAFRLFKDLADEMKDVDPDDEELAPIAAKSLTAVSLYLRTGITDAGVHADTLAADRALQRAALTFNDEDAQFELAKVLLRGEGPKLKMGAFEDPSSKIENGRHWLSRLSRSGHPGAQAFLADLLWRGKFMEKDQAAALNLIDVAASNAPPSERVWIEDIYQNIYCNAGEGVRQQATGRVAEWHNRYGRRPHVVQDRGDGLDALAADPVRICSNGELVKPMSTGLPMERMPRPPHINAMPANGGSQGPSSRGLGHPAAASGFAPASGVAGPMMGPPPAAAGFGAGAVP